MAGSIADMPMQISICLSAGKSVAGWNLLKNKGPALPLWKNWHWYYLSGKEELTANKNVDGNHCPVGVGCHLE